MMTRMKRILACENTRDQREQIDVEYVDDEQKL